VDRIKLEAQMASEAESYAKEMRSKWGLYFVDWPPGVALALGDYGGIIDSVFIKEGNLNRDYGIAFAADPAPESPNRRALFPFL
jgi:hypothetical protein